MNCPLVGGEALTGLDAEEGNSQEAGWTGFSLQECACRGVVCEARQKAGRAEAGGGRNGGRESKKGGQEVRARPYHVESHRLTRSLHLAPGIMKSRWKALSSSMI